MRKIIYTALVAVMSLFSVSCSDFLTEKSRTEVEKDAYMNNAAEAEKVLMGVYKTNSTQELYGYHLSILFSMGTDMEQIDGGTTNNTRIVPTNAFPTTQAEIQNTWKGLYSGVYRANDFIERITSKMQDYSETDKKLAELYIAEARALRAMFYFELVRLYGNVPLITSTEMSYQAPYTFVQSEPAAVYEYIEDDLEYAAEVLPYESDDTLRGDNTAFRFSKGGVLGLLTKVYATWAGLPVKDESKWEMAAKTAEKLITSGKHNLLPEYEQLWKNTCNGIWDGTESLIEISFYSPTSTTSSDPVGFIGKLNGVKTTRIAGVRGSCSGMYKVVHTFVLDWRDESNDGDLRRDISIANYRYDDSFGDGPILYTRNKVTVTEEVAKENDLAPDEMQTVKQDYTPAKWDIEKYSEASNKLIHDQKSNVNWYFLRYADVLLLYAEALNEWKGAPTQEAYEALNKVRRRGYGVEDNSHDVSTGLTQAQFRETVRKERTYELAFEGHRKHDLIRWGIYYEAVQSTYSKLVEWWIDDTKAFEYPVFTYTVKNKHELYPIPQREMDLCTKFEQNPGW